MTVEPERLAGWLERFAARHGPTKAVHAGEPGAPAVLVRAADGATASCAVPFPPLTPADPADPADQLVAHALVDRRVGVLLVRLGGHAAGVFVGRQLVASKVGSRSVHGRSAAGGWSQQRFARRREGQVRVAYAAAADLAAKVLLPARGDLDGLVLGGDRRATEAVLADPRLAPLRPLVTGQLLDVRDPRLRVLAACADPVRAVRIRVLEPVPEG